MKSLLGEIAREAGQYEIADRVIHRARRRRRFTRLAPVAAVVAVVAAVAGAWIPLHDRETGTHRAVGDGRTASAPEPGTHRADLIVGRTLYTAANHRVRLPVAARYDAYALPRGWLVVAVPKSRPGADVWWVEPGGAAHRLLTRVFGVAVDEAHQRLAWSDSGAQDQPATVTAARLDGPALRDEKTTRTQGLIPVLLFGSDGVLLARKGGDGWHGFDTWHPGTRRYHSTRHTGPLVLNVVGVDHRNGRLVGKVAGPNDSQPACVAELDPSAGLASGPASCSVPLGWAKGPGSVSPDGLALVTAADRADPGSPYLVGYRLTSGAPERAASWKIDGPAVWDSATTALVVVGGGDGDVLKRIDVRRPGVVTTVPLPDGASGAVAVVHPVGRR